MTTAVSRAAGSRLPYDELPAEIRRHVERTLGSTVVEARTQLGGFSPGAAARLVGANGRRAFVKAVGAPLNPDTPGMFRNEVASMRAIPHLPWVPRLLDTYDDGTWIALVFEDIEGRQPAHPWTADDVDLVFGAIADLLDALTPSPWADAPSVEDRRLFDRWHDLVEAPEPLHPSLSAHLDELAAMSARARRFVPGETLVHYDVRADNVLITPDRRVVFVDWAWPCRANPAVDVLLASMDIPVSGSAVDPDALLARHPTTREVDPDDLTALLATFVGTFVSAARRPAPPGLPTIRAFQQHVADSLTRWLCRRLSW